jgi:hypothetical protein
MEYQGHPPRYPHRIDGYITKDGHTMMLCDIVEDLKQIATLKAKVAELELQRNEAQGIAVDNGLKLATLKAEVEAANNEIIKVKTVLSNSVTVQYHDGIVKELAESRAEVAHKNKVIEVLAEQLEYYDENKEHSAFLGKRKDEYIKWAGAEAGEVE